MNKLNKLIEEVKDILYRLTETDDPTNTESLPPLAIIIILGWMVLVLIFTLLERKI